MFIEYATQYKFINNSNDPKSSHKVPKQSINNKVN